MRIRRSLLKDTVTVETYVGEGAYGPVYAAAVAVPCNVEATRRLVRNAAGDEAVSESTLYVRPSDASAFTPESRLTFATHASTVLAVSLFSLRGNVSHAKVSCK